MSRYGNTAVMQKGWLFSSKTKSNVIDILKQLKGVGIHDKARVDVALEDSDPGYLAKG